jgi:UDP-glucose 4,6-dehydratase
MRKIVITGGAGFIGSHVVERFCAEYPSAEIVMLDKMTYAADVRNVIDLIVAERAELVVGDVCDYELCHSLFTDCDLVIHAAAESHVDRSFLSSIPFTRSNALGTHTVMEACRNAGVPRIIHVSTDEVYGEVLTGSVDENGILNPTNPYSASKAAAEMIVNGYRHSYNLPVMTVRANNIFGIRQYPEKLIPRSIMNLAGGGKIELHGDGTNVRHFLSAVDFADALVLLAQTGKIHDIYNIGSPDEFSNREIAAMICREFGIDFDSHVVFVSDRPFNDRRYAVTYDKIVQLGWAPRRSLKSEMGAVVRWYRDNAEHLAKRIQWSRASLDG